jgi:hypothetical protein
VKTVSVEKDQIKKGGVNFWVIFRGGIAFYHLKLEPPKKNTSQIFCFKDEMTGFTGGPLWITFLEKANSAIGRAAINPL